MAVAMLSGLVLAAHAELVVPPDNLPSQPSAPASQGKATDQPKPAAGVISSVNGSAKKAQAGSQISPQVTELVWMAESGVEAPVIKAYVESSATVDRPSAEEIIYLREHGLSSEVIAALIRRGGELREQSARASQQVQAQAAQQAAASAAIAAAQPYAAPAYTQPTYIESYPNYVYTGYPVYNYGWPGYTYFSYPVPVFFHRGFHHGFFAGHAHHGFRGGLPARGFGGFRGFGRTGGMAHPHR